VSWAKVDFEFFTGVSVLFLIGSAWAHLAVKLDRLTRSSHRHSAYLGRLERRLARVESWLPARDSVK
jgi:hypothetical protein